MSRKLGEDQEDGVVTRSKPEKKTKKPPLFRVLFHNDDYTTREFVVYVLNAIFHHDEASATRIMWHVHTQGVGVAGVYTFEIAETKAAKVEDLARLQEYPLRVTIEPDD